MQSLHRPFAHDGMGTRHHQRRRLAARHFLGKAGAAQHPCNQLRRHLLLDFVRQQPEGRTRLHGFEALAQPDQRHSGSPQLLQLPAQAGHRHRQHEQVIIRHIGSGSDAAGHRQCLRKCHARQIAGIAAFGLHGLGMFGLTRPEGHLMVLCSVDGNCGAPGARSQNGNLHRVFPKVAL